MLVERVAVGVQVELDFILGFDLPALQITTMRLVQAVQHKPQMLTLLHAADHAHRLGLQCRPADPADAR